MAMTGASRRTQGKQLSLLQPVKEFLATEFVIGKIFVATNTVWISLICLVLTLTFFIIAYATVAWGIADSTDGARRMVGLWQECHSETGCIYHGSSEAAELSSK